MNELARAYGDRLVVLAFPCNQFGHQEWTHNDTELLNLLKHVRPGNGYEPEFPIFSKVNVNGDNAHPLFQFLRETLPFPHDNPSDLMADPKLIIWSPVQRNDISWNFEKFLIGPDGVPFRRYSRSFLTSDIKTDIDALLGTHM